jgi:hypothetical protein
LALGFEQLTPSPAPESHAAEDYAVALSANERGHLSGFMAAPNLYVPSGGFLSLGHSLADAVSAERRQFAQEAEKRIATAAAAEVKTEFHIVQNSHAETCKSIAAAARLSDIAIAARPANGLSLDQNLIERMLFTSGRPLLVTPPNWDKGPQFQTIVAAWEGSARAARAVGDSIPFLARANTVEILCASPDVSKCIDGAPLARHCKAVTFMDLPAPDCDIARALGARAMKARAELFVTGGYGHARLLEMVLGGVTSIMLSEAELPLLMSY